MEPRRRDAHRFGPRCGRNHGGRAGRDGPGSVAGRLGRRGRFFRSPKKGGGRHGSHCKQKPPHLWSVRSSLPLPLALLRRPAVQAVCPSGRRTADLSGPSALSLCRPVAGGRCVIPEEAR